MTDWLTRMQETADRFRAEDDTPPSATQNQSPRTIKRNPNLITPSGAAARSVKARNAYQRVKGKQGKP